MQTDKRFNTHIFRFDSVHELMEEVQKSVSAADWQWQASMKRMLQEPEWVGRSFWSLKNACDAFNERWEEGMRLYEETLAETREFDVPRPTNIRRVSKWSEDHGDEVSIDRLRSGDPFWRTTERTGRPGPVNKTILIHNGVRSREDNRIVTWRGVAATVLTEILEQAGFRVDIYSFREATASYSDNSNHACIVNLKRSSDTLDHSSLVNTLSGWFFRTVYLHGISLRGPKGNTAGCGSSSPVRGWAQRYIGDEDASLLDKGDVYDKETALRWVKNELDRIINPPPPPPPPSYDPPPVNTTPIKPMSDAEFKRLMKQLEKDQKARLKEAKQNGDVS